MKIKVFEKIGKEVKKITPEYVSEWVLKNKKIFKSNDVLYFEDENGELKNASVGERTELFQYLRRMKVKTIDHPTSGEFLPSGVIKTALDLIVSFAEDGEEEKGDLIKFSNGYYSISQKRLIDTNQNIIERLKYDYLIEIDEEEKKFCDEYLNNITDGDKGKIHNLLCVMALAIMRNNRNNKIINIYGNAGTGKSTFGYLLEQLAGEQNTSHLQPYQFGQNFAKSTLLNKTLNLSYETTKREVSDTTTAFIKALAGEDTITTDIKFHDPIEFRSKAQQVFIGNYPLNFGENMDSAIEDRVINIELNHRFRNTSEQHHSMKELLTRKKTLSTFSYLALLTVNEKGLVSFEKDNIQILKDQFNIDKPDQIPFV